MYLKNEGPCSLCDEAVLQRLDTSYRRWRRIDRQVDRFILILLLALAALACGLYLDSRQTAVRSPIGADPCDFDALAAINPDIVAWLRVDDTNVDYPVVQGKDNFEYLDKGFDGGFCAGGALFLDAANAPDLSDNYNIIHGHNMAGDAMFGCLEHYLEEDWFREHRRAELRTPSGNYDLQLIAAGVYDAYDSGVYAPGENQPLEAIGRSMLRTNDAPGAASGAWAMEANQVTGAHKAPGTNHTASARRVTNTGYGASANRAAGAEHAAVGEWNGGARMLALSTCAGDMSDNRIVVFWAMTEKGEHGGRDEQEDERGPSADRESKRGLFDRCSGEELVSGGKAGRQIGSMRSNGA